MEGGDYFGKEIYTCVNDTFFKQTGFYFTLAAASNRLAMMMEERVMREEYARVRADHNRTADYNCTAVPSALLSHNSHVRYQLIVACAIVSARGPLAKQALNHPPRRLSPKVNERYFFIYD